MSVHDDIYMPFWRKFSSNPLGPCKFTNREPEPKTNKDRFGYMVLGEKIGLGFRPIGTVSKQKNRLGVELITSSMTGREFAKSNFSAIIPPKLGNQVATLEYPGDETKISITWSPVDIGDEKQWPAYFLWIRLGIHTLADVYEPHIAGYGEGSSYG